MVDLQLNGSIFDFGSATPVNPWTGRDALELSAWPSVMSDRTQLRLSRGLDTTAELQVFDVKGRLVRNLTVHTGQLTVGWDGRDGNGRNVASGVYLARIRGDQEGARAKMVKVR